MLDVLVEGVDVVLGLLTRLLLVGLGVFGQEVEGPPVGRPRRGAGGGGVGGQRLGFAALHRQQVDLRGLGAAALGDEGDPLAVGRPPRLRLAVGARGELRRITAVDAHPPQVADALVGLPVGVGLDEHHLPAVGRQLRGAHRRHADEVDDRHRPLGQGRSGQDEQHAEQGSGAAKGHGGFLLDRRERSPECNSKGPARGRGGCDLRHAPSPPRHHATQPDRLSSAIV